MSELIGDAGGAAAAALQPIAVREKPPISIYPQLKNVVSSVDLGTRIDLKSITMRMRNAEYMLLRFLALPDARQPVAPLQVQPKALLRGHYPTTRSQDHCSRI